MAQALDPKPTVPRPPGPFLLWLLEGHTKGIEGPASKGGAHHEHPWWQVMCLTGVDYFSTLGYQPGIAALAAGALSPVATLILVLLTLLGALPIYGRVARESPHGEGSIAMLEHLLTWWKGKLFVLALLGFVATDFIITITLSAADATAHIVENPFAPRFLHGHEIAVTLALVALLGAVFLKGFKEAMGIAVALVAVYLALNAVVVGYGLYRVAAHPQLLGEWKGRLFQAHGNPLVMFGIALLLFPKLALGLSGFETGVAVMPLVKGEPSDTPDHPEGRIRHTRKLLLFAALIMSVFLITSSLVTTLLIPADEFRAASDDHPAGKANGRALAYLAHSFFGEAFGTAYDLSTILILWFAGASAMAGLLNIVPRYLPRFGMAPEWTRAARPLVLIYTAIAFAVTIIFRASVDAQGGAYATGVLVLMTSAAVAVTLSAWRTGDPRGGGRVRGHRAGLRLHDGRQRRRAAGRREDRRLLHHRDRGRLARLAALADAGAARGADRAGRRGAAVRRGGRRRGTPHHRQPPGQPRLRRIRREGAGDPRGLRHPARPARAVPGDLRARRVRLLGRPAGGGGERGRAPGAPRRRRRSRTRSRRCCSTSAMRRGTGRTPISTGRRATRCST